MPLFEVDRESNTVREIPARTFPDLRLWERQDLEAWVESAPAMAGGDFVVVTAEYDRFDRTSERLDILGVVGLEEGVGRLVVVELKRDGTSTTVDLQAIKYAAYVAASQFSDVVEMHAAYHGLEEVESRRTLIDLLGGTDDEPPTIDDTPRIVLVAADFRPEVTTTVLWLIDSYGMDLRWVRLQPFEVGDRLVVSSELLIPLPAAKQYRLGVQMKRREAVRELQEKTRAGRLLPRLFEAGAVELGQTLYFRRDVVGDGTGPAWSTEEPLYRSVVVADQGIRTLEWHDPADGLTRVESPSLLAARILHQIGRRDGEVTSAGINGMHYWTVDGETSLRDLAAEAGVTEQAARHIDREALYRVCAAIPEGSWTTYGAIAAAIGVPGAAQSVAGVIATDANVENAHRVLRSGGRVAPGWVADDGGGPEVARTRLIAEGMRLDENGGAHADAFWEPSNFGTGQPRPGDGG